MPKISRGMGPSYVDTEGEPQQGAVPNETEQSGRVREALQVENRPAPHGGAGAVEPAEGPDAAPQDEQGQDAAETDAQPAEGDNDSNDVAAEDKFDPGKHTVNDVNDYLARLPEWDADERERVLNAEAAGKNRAGIMTGRAAGYATDPSN